MSLPTGQSSSSAAVRVDGAAVSANGAEPSLGDLVKDATEHLSTLLHNEIELAKIEVRSSAKNAGTGVASFGTAAVLVVYGLTFGLIALAEGLVAAGIWRWAAYLIVFGLLLIIAGIAALIGRSRIKKVKAPERTIETLNDTAEFLRHPINTT